MTGKKAALIVIGVLALEFLGTSGQIQADLIVNGGFEQYTPGTGGINGTTPVSNGDLQYSPVTGWTEPSTAVGSKYPLNLLELPMSNSMSGAWDSGNSAIRYLWGPPGVMNGYTAPSPAGGNYLALDADPQYSGAISQTVTGLVPGQKYQLSFYWAAAQLYPAGGPTTEQLQISFGSQTQSTPILNNTSGGFVPWRLQTLTFTADSSSDVLSFLAEGGPSGDPPFVLLDGVSLTASVPEPGTVLLVSMGLLGIGIFRRLRRRAKSVAA